MKSVDFSITPESLENVKEVIGLILDTSNLTNFIQFDVI